MLIALFVFEIIILGLTILTTHMVEHKLHMIQASLDIYCNKRTYKTKADIDFIENIMTSYKKLAIDTDEEPDLESAIKRRLQHEYIGRFPYVSVKNIALKVKNLMWGIVVLEVLIAWMNQMTGSGQAVIIITASVLLTVIMSIYVIIRGVEEKSEALIDEVIHYVRNIYPLEQIKQQKEMPITVENTISLEAHKEKRAGKSMLVRDQAFELRNYAAKGQSKELVSEAELLGSKQVVNEESQLKSKSIQEKQLNEKQSKELSAKDIAKLLDSL